MLFSKKYYFLKSCWEQEYNFYLRDTYMFSENGRYLGLDLGSTNFRVVLVDLKDGVAETTTKYYNLTDDQLSGPAELVK